MQNIITNFIKFNILFWSYKLSKKWGPLHTSTQMLYTILQDHDYINTDFYLFNYARHARLAVDKNQPLLQNAVHTFYEKYNFPHNKKYPKIAPGHYL